jgi:uncharacterized membrane protein
MEYNNDQIKNSKELGMIDLTEEELARALEREKEFAELRKINDEKRAEQLKLIEEKKNSKTKNNPELQRREPIVVKTYRGTESEAISKFKKDAVLMSSMGYTPTNQVWVAGKYSGMSFFIALLLCFVLLGFLIFIYMLIVKPDGSLTVTYQRQVKNKSKETNSSVADEIKKLSELHQAGVLTLEEFQAQKQKLLG